MDRIQAIRQEKLAEIKQLDGGMKAVAQQMGCTARNVERILTEKNGRTPRLRSLERVSRAIIQVQKDEEARINALSSGKSTLVLAEEA